MEPGSHIGPPGRYIGLPGYYLVGDPALDVLHCWSVHVRYRTGSTRVSPGTAV